MVSQNKMLQLKGIALTPTLKPALNPLISTSQSSGNFGDLENEFIRDRMVCGTLSDDVLFHVEGLSLDKVMLSKC